MLKTILKFGVGTALLLIVVAILLFIVFPGYVYYNYRQYVYVDQSSVQNEKVAIVFGASTYGIDEPSPPLKERIETAAELYLAQKVKKIIVSGNAEEFYNEPETMKNTLVKLGIPESYIILDKYGFRTYDTCYRAKNVYKIDKALLISQGYHLPRAIFTCRSLGIEATGVYTKGTFSTFYSRWYTVREILAIYAAFKDVYIDPPKLSNLTPTPIQF